MLGSFAWLAVSCSVFCAAWAPFAYAHASGLPVVSKKPAWLSNQQNAYQNAQKRLHEAIKHPEFMLDHWIDLPTSPESANKTPMQLGLREAILLALRYNPNIKNAELDRIIQRYQLRIAYNEFELQYALAGTAEVQRSSYENVGSTTVQNYIASPELHWKNKLGTTMSLNLTNNVSNFNSFSPVLNFQVTQPLLRGFGKAVNEVPLLNALDSEFLNKVNLVQSVCDQVTLVIVSYRTLILSGNNLHNQQRQLKEAQKTFDINAKKIAAGQLEPTGNIQQSYQIESLSLLVEQAQNDFKTASQNLLQVIGLDPRMRLLVPSDVNVERIFVPDLQKSIEAAFKNNAQYLAMNMQVRADKRAYLVAKNQQAWQLDVGANVQTGRLAEVDGINGLTSIYNGRNVNESAKVTLRIPLNDVERKSMLINAKVKLEKDHLNLLALRRELTTMITNTVNTIQSLAKRLELAQKQVKLAQQSYTLEKKKQQAGISSSLDVNNTQNQLIQAQMNLINAKIAYLNQLSDLQRVLGTTLNEWQLQLR